MRNDIDVAHASYVPLSDEERDIVLEFTQTAIERVGGIIAALWNGAKAGTVTLEPVDASSAGDRSKLLQAFEEYIAQSRT
jgi:hypothetical protein